MIALLAWNEQIRGLAKDTKDLERRFREKHKISAAEFHALINLADGDAQLAALTNLINRGEARAPAQQEIIRLFQNWAGIHAGLNRLALLRYNLAVSLTVVLLLSGTAATIFPLVARYPTILLLPSLLLCAALLAARG